MSLRKVRKGVSEAMSVARILRQTTARHAEPSIILSADDEDWPPTQRLLDLGVSAAARASRIDLAMLDERSSTEPRWYRTFPGEHYRLLAALVAEIGAARVIEIGTFTGMGTLALASALPAGGRVDTFDLIPWHAFPQTWLQPEDFAAGSVRQHIANIATPGGIDPFLDLFQAADLIFVDGPKDGVTEGAFLRAIGSLSLPRNPVVMFDDIRVLNMIRIWRELARPKLDLTSFGHWSGTGLIDWNGTLPASGQ